ncbi:hypothetical protein [Moheibacter sediminis]|uniref:Lipoprotein n=1 Tax=Moheibacter sediminis TaxID=1434700 RepID=A0A1W1Z188_9FLAO|nr:hypothetical protein [Moheibacter sediminis]SMC42154.1 hypothetical protein SAMN06296427_10295 [Moheibacter sediminis]
MKKLFYLFSIAILLVSCQITERVYIQENGGVKYETEMNFTEMMGMMFSQESKDSLRLIGQFPIDSVMTFSDLEKMDPKLNPDKTGDAEREFLNVMDKMKVRMVMNDNEGKISFGVEEKDVKSFNSYMKEIKTAGEKLAKEDKAAADNLAQSGMLNFMEFKYDGKSFQRIASSETSKMLGEMNDSTAESTRQMMGMFQYKIEYHFPKKIKKSNIENATYSLDGKTMTVDVPMIELMEDPEKYNFKIEFE